MAHRTGGTAAVGTSVGEFPGERLLGLLGLLGWVDVQELTKVHPLLLLLNLRSSKNYHRVLWCKLLGYWPACR